MFDHMAFLFIMAARKQTVLVESEFKFLHELVSTIPDVQCTEDEQPSSHLPHQPPLHEVSLSRPATDHGTLATAANNTSSTTVAKPGGKQRGRFVLKFYTGAF